MHRYFGFSLPDLADYNVVDDEIETNLLPTNEKRSSSWELTEKSSSPFLTSLNQMLLKSPVYDTDDNDFLNKYLTKIADFEKREDIYVLPGQLLFWLNPHKNNDKTLQKSLSMVNADLKDFRKTLKKSQPSIVIVQLTLVFDSFTEGLLANLEDVQAAHANILVFDLVNHVTERFDPNGYWNNGYPRDKFSAGLATEFVVNDLVQQTVQDIFPAFADFEYKVIGEMCPAGLGPQAKSSIMRQGELGLCESWCAFYLHHRLQNPEIPPKELMDELLELDGNHLRSLILDFIEEGKRILERKKRRVGRRR